MSYLETNSAGDDTDMSRRFIAAGAILAALAVMAGAFGAHALEGLLTEERLSTYETAVRYHMYHAIALILVGWIGRRRKGAMLQWAGFLFLGGILLFSGSLYALVLTEVLWLGMITPLGGVAFIVGWLLFARGAAQPY